MNLDTTEWLARWSGIAARMGLTLVADGDAWRLDPVSEQGASQAAGATVSDEVARRPDGRVVTRRMTREDVEAFFGPDDGPI